MAGQRMPAQGRSVGPMGQHQMQGMSGMAGMQGGMAGCAMMGGDSAGGMMTGMMAAMQSGAMHSRELAQAMQVAAPDTATVRMHFQAAHAAMGQPQPAQPAHRR